MLPMRRHLRSDDGVIVTTWHNLTNVHCYYYLSSIRISIHISSIRISSIRISSIRISSIRISISIISISIIRISIIRIRAYYSYSLSEFAARLWVFKKTRPPYDTLFVQSSPLQRRHRHRLDPYRNDRSRRTWLYCNIILLPSNFRWR